MFVLAPTLLTWTRDQSFSAASTAARWLVVAALLRVVLGLYTPLAQALGRPRLALYTGLELFLLLAASLFVCLTVFSGPLSIAAAGVAWCFALTATLLLARAHFRSFFPA